MNYYAFHIGDYASKTRHLTWDEDMAYRRLLDAYYSTEKPLPSDLRQVYRLVMAATPEHRQAVDAILSEFFTLTENGYQNAKCDEVIADATAKKEKAKASADKRWGNASAMQAQSEGNAKAPTEDANAYEKPCEGNAPNPNPNPNTQIDASHLPRARGKDEFDQFEATLRAIPSLDQQAVAASPDVSPIWRLVQAGYDLHGEILPVIRDVVAKARPKTISNWSYFARIVEERRSRSSVAAVPPPAATDRKEWIIRMRCARELKTWQRDWGPKPNEPGCMAPVDMVLPTDDPSGLDFFEDRKR